MLNTRRLLGGMLAVLLVSGVAGAQTPPVRPRAQTVSTDTPEIAALRVKANAGDAAAQFYLGLMYDLAWGVPQDFAQAVAWYRKAAEQGLANAQFNLGLMYATGQGVPQDAVSAYLWFNLSAARGTGETQKKYATTRDALAKTMTPTQIESGQRLSREWFAAFEKRGGK